MSKTALIPSLTPEGSLSRYMEQIRQFPMLEPDEEYMLAHAFAERGDVASAHKLVTSHLRLVAKIAMGYRGYGLPIADLISEGNLGMMHAVKKFDPERGFRLATYAMWWIKASMQEYILRSWSLVKIGTTAAQKSLFFNIRRRMAERPWEDSLPEELARSLAARFNTSVTEVLKFGRRIKRTDQSLDVPAARETSETLVDQVIDERPTPEDSVIKEKDGRLWRDRLVKALSTLPPRESLIIRRRFLAERVPSRADLGAELGLSKERVRQLEVRALAKLKGLLQPLREHAESTGGNPFSGNPTRTA